MPIPQLKPELYRLIARHVRYPTEEEKKANPRVELANQADLLNMMKASKTTYEQGVMYLYTHMLVDRLSKFVDATQPPKKQDRWKYVESLRLYFGRSAPPYREDTLRDLQEARVEPWNRHAEEAFYDNEYWSEPLATLLPRLQRVVLHQAQVMMLTRDRWGRDRTVDHSMGLSLLQMAAGRHLCQTGVQGPLDLQHMARTPRPVATFTFHPPAWDGHETCLPAPIVLGTRNRHVYARPLGEHWRPWPLNVYEKLSLLADSAVGVLEKETVDPFVEFAPVWNLRPEQLEGTTIELFGFLALSDLDNQAGTASPDPTVSSLEDAQRFLDREMGVWAGTIKLRHLSDAPPCPACGYKLDDDGEVLESGM